MALRLATDSASDCAFGRGVDVVEGEERHIEQAEQLEGDVGLGARLRHRIRAMVPGPQESLATEGIAAGPAERMPVADGEAQMILEPPSAHDAILVVPSERERAFCVLAAIGDRRGRVEELGGAFTERTPSARDIAFATGDRLHHRRRPPTHAA